MMRSFLADYQPGAHLIPGRRRCAHITYRLSCDQFDRLVADAGDVCQICRRWQVECIDHDATVGQWAVRGLLCLQCNTKLGVNDVFCVEARSYLDNPWYLTMLARLGFPPDVPTEPPIGATVAAFRSRWVRRDDVWHRMDRSRSSVQCATWFDLHKQYGPHNLVRTDTVTASVEALNAAVARYRAANSRPGRRDARNDAVTHMVALLDAGVRPTEVAAYTPFSLSYVWTLTNERAPQ